MTDDDSDMTFAGVKELAHKHHIECNKKKALE